MKNQFTEAQLKWLEALESGKYEQTIGALRDSKGFCCLGVACDISGLGDWVVDKLYLGNSGLLPDEVQEYFSLRDNEGEPRDPRKFTPLTAMNDKGKSFKEIAAHLRKHPEQYFTNFEVQS